MPRGQCPSAAVSLGSRLQRRLMQFAMQYLQPGEPIYIATDETAPDFFAPFERAGHTVFRWHDFFGPKGGSVLAGTHGIRVVGPVFSFYVPLFAGMHIPRKLIGCIEQVRCIQLSRGASVVLMPSGCSSARCRSSLLEVGASSARAFRRSLRSSSDYEAMCGLRTRIFTGITTATPASPRWTSTHSHF